MARTGLPWLKKEKAFIKMAVEEKGIPFLGLCLGHQLLAESLGGLLVSQKLLRLVSWRFN